MGLRLQLILPKPQRLVLLALEARSPSRCGLSPERLLHGATTLGGGVNEFREVVESAKKYALGISSKLV